LVNKREGIAMQREYALQGKATRHATTVVAGMRDEDLIESIARGDKGAMRVLYTRHSVRIYRFTLTAADGKKIVLYQATMVPAFIKGAIRAMYGEKY